MVREYIGHFGRFSAAARCYLGAHFHYHVGQTTAVVLRVLFLKAAGFDGPFIGSTIAASAFGMLTVGALLARFMDRMRLKGFMLTGMVLQAGSLAAVAILPYADPIERFEFPVMALCFLTGLGAGLIQVASEPFYTRHSREGERPYLFGVAMALSPVAGLTASLGGQLGAIAWGENMETYRAVMLAGAGLALMAVIWLLFVREAEADPAPETESEDRVHWPTAARFAFPEMLVGLGAGLTIPILPLFFQSPRFGFEPGTIWLFYAGTQALMMVAFLLAPVIARRLGAVRTIVFSQLTSLPFFLILAFTTTPWLAVGAFLLRHPCMNMVHPVASNFMMGVVPPRQRARVNGIKQIANRIAWVIAAWSGMRIVEATGGFMHPDGFATVMILTTALYVTAAWLFWKFFRGTVISGPAAEFSSGEGSGSVR